MDTKSFSNIPKISASNTDKIFANFWFMNKMKFEHTKYDISM